MTIIEQAIELEVKAEANYREAAEATSDPSAQRILGLLADEEAKHAKALRGMRSADNLDGRELLEQARRWIRGVVEGGSSAISTDKGMLQVLRRAMESERATEVFYRDQAAHADDKDVCSLFETLANIEAQHHALVGSLVEYYDRPNEWIEDAEFGIRDEY